MIYKTSKAARDNTQTVTRPLKADKRITRAYRRPSAGVESSSQVKTTFLTAEQRRSMFFLCSNKTHTALQHLNGTELRSSGVRAWSRIDEIPVSAQRERQNTHKRFGIQCGLVLFFWRLVLTIERDGGAAGRIMSTC